MIPVIFTFMPSAFNQSVGTPDMFALTYPFDLFSVFVLFVFLPQHAEAKTNSTKHHKHNRDILNRHSVVSFLLALRNKISLTRLFNLCKHESKQTFWQSRLTACTSESVAVGLFVVK